LHIRFCAVCGEDGGCPNVRAAAMPEEQEALEQRFLAALGDTGVRGCRHIAEDFSRAVLRSSAIICRGLEDLSTLVSGDNALFPSYHKKVRAEIVLPAKNEFDPMRPGVDGTFFPYFQDEIRFAALSLERRGSSSYGEYAIVMKDATISKRASVFEENTLVFARKFNIAAGGPLPFGYRATWDERNKPAVAKLHPQLSATTTLESFPGILLRDGGCTDKDDFIEVHIYGPLHRRAIEVVLGPKPKNSAESAFHRSIDRKLREVGSHLEVLE